MKKLKPKTTIETYEFTRDEFFKKLGIKGGKLVSVNVMGKITNDLMFIDTVDVSIER